MAKKSKDMEIKEIDLTQATEVLVEAIEKETNQQLLAQAFDKESQKGKHGRDQVIDALTIRMGQLAPRSLGKGAEGKPDGFGDYFEYTEDKPFKSYDHSDGVGSESTTQPTHEQKVMAEISKDRKEKMIRDLERITKPKEKLKNGFVKYEWGSIGPAREEVVENGKVVLSRKPSTIFLSYCPDCGRKNQPEQGEYGDCVHCGFSISERIIRPNLDRFPGVVLE